MSRSTSTTTQRTWRRERSGPERYDFWTRASLYALLAVVPVLARALARAQQHVRVPGLAVFLLLSVAQAATCVALLHVSLSFYLARGPRPKRWLVAAAIALTPVGLLAGAAAFPDFTRIAAGQIPVSAWVAMLFCAR